jgi:predicted PolB exonuclease-like 3'-5' exonuclease
MHHTPSLQNILFVDIETVPLYPSFEALPEAARPFWNKKADHMKRDAAMDTPETLYPRAGLYAEFGKIACISCGIVHGCGEEKKLIIKSFCCEDEREMLAGFCEMLNKWATPEKVLCAHNGKEFDFPFISRRLVINQLPVPCLLQCAGKRPWEIQHLDTLELWKFGEYKNFTALNLLAFVLCIPTPKDDIDGSHVWSVYWNEKNLERIVTYCQKDVITVTQVYLKLTGDSLIKSGNIDIKP